MRSVSRINKVLVIVLAAAIATVAMALPVCASTPLPSSTPNPNIYPSHIDATLQVYYTKYFKTTSYMKDSYIGTDGELVSYSNAFYSSFIPVSPSIDSMICLRTVYGNAWVSMISVAFYDANYDFVSCFTDVGYKFNSIPTGVSYFRVSFVGSNITIQQAANRYKVCLSPEDIAFNPATRDFVSDFWRDYLYVQPYMIYEDGRSAFVMTSSYPYDGVYAEITLSQSFHIANYVSATVYTTVKDGGYNNSFYPVEYNDRDERDALPQYLTMRPFYIDSNGQKSYPDTFDVGSVLSDNPATVFVYSADGLISGFNLYIPLNAPTGLTANSTVQVEISNIAFDDMSVVIPEWSISTVNQIENAVAAAEVPVPSFDLGDIVVNAISNVDFNAANNLFGWFWGISIVASMTALVGMFCLIGYVFFGKKG